MNTGLLITLAALVVALVVGALAIAYLIRRRERKDIQLAIAPRLQAWVEPPQRRGPTAEAPEHVPTEAALPVATEVSELDAAETPSAAAETLTAPPLAPASPPDPGKSPDEFEPLAPIEITVGDDRVALTEGTETHRRLRKYADHLLGDLKAARRHTR